MLPSKGLLRPKVLMRLGRLAFGFLGVLGESKVTQPQVQELGPSSSNRECRRSLLNFTGIDAKL